MNILIVAPHPDDEILGCGGVIAKHVSEKDKVFSLIVSKGMKELYSDDQIQQTRNEARRAHSYLGIKETVFLDYPAPALDTVPNYMLSSDIRNFLINFDINVLYIPHRGDIHQDHTKVYYSSLIAARPVSTPSVRKIFAYETLSETEWSPPTSDAVFIPNVFVNIERYLNSKIEAMKIYKSQLKNFPNPRSIESIIALSKFRGSTVMCSAAESFELIREIM